LSDRALFVGAVILYGISATYSIFLFRRGFRKDNRINYGLLLAGFCLHTAAMLKRGFSLQRCPINNLYEATMFIDWTIVTAYLPVGAWHRFRFLGAFASPVLFAVGVFALMPALDVKAVGPVFTGGMASLHKALILLAFGAFGLSSVAAFMYLTQEHDLKFHKVRAVFSLLPPIQRLEHVIGRLLLVGFLLLSGGLVASMIFLKQTHGVYFEGDALMLYSFFVWMIYGLLLVLRWKFNQRGRRIAWGAILAFSFVMLTFWGIYLLSGLHNPARANSARLPSVVAVKPAPSCDPSGFGRENPSTAPAG
jgi:HemX protein